MYLTAKTSTNTGKSFKIAKARLGRFLCGFVGNLFWPPVFTGTHQPQSVLMDSKNRLKEIFITILVAVMVCIIFLHFERWPGHASGPAYRAMQTSSPVVMTPEPHWEDPGPYHVAYPRNYKFIMDDTPTCKSTAPFLILMVPTAPGEAMARDAIRKTWGSEKMVLDQLVETVFIVGLPRGDDAYRLQESLKQENEQHHDIVQSSFLDSYNNLTIKTMVMLEWLSKNCTESSFAMKIDSDMLLHVKNLVKLLLNPSTAKQHYMTGLVWWHSPVLRNPFNKFYMPRSVIPEPEYPPYPLGMAYVMSLDLPEKILDISPQIKPIYIEDAYLGMCLKLLRISPTDPPETSMFLVTPQHPLSSCSLSQVIAMTTTATSQMNWYWLRIQKGVQCQN